MNKTVKISVVTASLTIAAVTATALAQGAVNPTTALAQLGSKVYSTGPNGEQPAPASSVTLTAAEIAKVKAMKATAAATTLTTVSAASENSAALPVTHQAANFIASTTLPTAMLPRARRSAWVTRNP